MPGAVKHYVERIRCACRSLASKECEAGWLGCRGFCSAVVPRLLINTVRRLLSGGGLEKKKKRKRSLAESPFLFPCYNATRLSFIPPRTEARKEKRQSGRDRKKSASRSLAFLAASAFGLLPCKEYKEPPRHFSFCRHSRSVYSTVQYCVSCGPG